MRVIELVLVVAAAVGLSIWRGLALYRQTFKRKEL
jgi:hypothetical protein